MRRVLVSVVSNFSLIDFPKICIASAGKLKPLGADIYLIFFSLSEPVDR